jgi:ActR/RegA family two-component response regulator
MSETSAAPEAPIRVLIVEHRPETRETLENSLSRWGYKPVLAKGSGSELLKDAIEKVRSHRCHLAIVDKRLVDDGDSSDFGGLDLIKEIAPAVAIILTGYADYATARNALKQGAFDVLRKEDGPAALRQALEKAAAEKWFRREVEFDRPPELKSAALVRRFFPTDDLAPLDQVDDVLRHLFPTAHKLRIEAVSGDDSMSSLLLRTRSAVMKVSIDDAQLPSIVKIARAGRVKKEIEHFRHVQLHFPAYRHATIQGQPVELWDLGGVIYDFIGGDNQYPQQVFAYFYATHDAEEINKAIDNFQSLWRPLYQRRPSDGQPQKKRVIAAYTDVWGREWLEELVKYRQLPSEVRLPAIFDELGLPDPIQWLIKKIKLVVPDEDGKHLQYEENATPFTTLALCHGDLHSRNIFVDTRYDVWVIDYERTGFGPILQDWVELIVDILTMLADEQSDEWHSFVQLLTSVLSLQALGSKKIASEVSGEYNKEYGVIVHLLNTIVPEYHKEDAQPLYWGIFLNALYRFTILRKYWDQVAQLETGDPKSIKKVEESKQKLTMAMQRCRVIGGMVCYRLEKWNREKWPPRVGLQSRRDPREIELRNTTR